MTPGRCDRSWEAEAYRDGRLAPKDIESFDRHCQTCAACAEALARDERLRALGRALPAVEPAPLELRRLRGRILRDVAMASPAPHPLSWRRVALASSLGIAVAAMVTLVVLRSVARTSAASVRAMATTLATAPLAGAVTASAEAVWTQERQAGIESVVLQAGTLRVHVRPQGPGERFLVRLPDGEIEVRGTTFEVTALGGSTWHVGVSEGTVVLRLRGSPDRSLGPGSVWAAPESSAPNGPTAPVRAAASPPAIVRRTPAVHDADEGAAAYVEAMRSFREGRYDRAAAAFHAFALAFPGATEAEDASFLEALSLARAGRADAAALAAQRHLESFPQSFRRKEASILVARAASRRGRCDEALGVLAPWIASPDAEIESVLVTCRRSGTAGP